MVFENKNNQNYIESRLKSVGETIGMIVVGVATLANMADIANHESRQIIGFMQPAYATTAVSIDEQGSNTEFRRGGREEIRHTSASYGVITRSHATAGKR